MGQSFNKIVPEIIQSSIWNEESDIRIVWITMIATKDQDGYVRGDARTIARMANVSVEATEKALKRFQEPDINSHTPDNDGRRIVPASGGWMVINSDVYRETGMNEAQREYWRERQRISRDKKKNVNDKSKTCPRLVLESDVLNVSVSSVSVLDKEVKEEKIVLPFESDDFKDAWKGYCDNRKSKRSKMTYNAMLLIFKKLPKIEAEAIACLEYSTMNGYTGIFPDTYKSKLGVTSQPKPAHQQTATFHSTGDEYLKSKGLI